MENLEGIQIINRHKMGEFASMKVAKKTYIKKGYLFVYGEKRSDMCRMRKEADFVSLETYSDFSIIATHNSETPLDKLYKR